LKKNFFRNNIYLLLLKECIILAGGLGTRLRSVVDDKPKVLAPVYGKPFLKYVIDYAHQQGCTRIVLSAGYLHEQIEEFVQEFFKDSEIVFAVEEKPLGTGGGIVNALHQCRSDEVLVLNGDTFFELDYSMFYHHHHHHEALFSIALKPMKNFERYGTVECDQHRCITAFKEKEFLQEGLINAGVYIINRNAFLSLNWPEKFSMEKDFMEKFIGKIKMCAFPYDEYFIDIGIPEDYAKAQEDFKTLFK
jgi:D-glycero-alpha-D-manno-heptose 1-phosphate guanylyltransferase